MSDFLSTLGIQSYCFRASKTNDEVIERLKACGVSAIEICAVHADFSDPSTFDGIIDTYARNDVSILSIGVETLSDDEAAMRPKYEFMKQSGARVMSIDFQPETSPASWHLAEKMAEEYDVRLGIHNHGGQHWLGCAKILEHIFSKTNDRIGLCLDTAWALDSREDPVAMAQRFADRLHGVHIKDFIFDRASQPEDVIVGTGNLDLPALLSTMKTGGFEGSVVLEYEGDVDNPVPTLVECVSAVRGADA